MDYAVKMEHICKSFSGVKVLQDVDFELRSGEIHGLMGSNGAGKSTLIKILSGAHKKDSGRILVEGNEVDIQSPLDSKSLGIQCIYQELSLVPHLSVANNIFLGMEKTSKGFVCQAEINRMAQEMMDNLNLNINVKTMVGRLGIGAQFFTEICRCMVGNARIVIMDEPTSAMTPVEYQHFLKTIRLLRTKGISIIYISHRLDEIFEICDRITILKDGKNRTTCKVQDITMQEMITQMVGKDASGYLRRTETGMKQDAPVILSVKGVTNSKLHDISFELKKGEILGVTGLLGAGKTELAQVLFGADRITAGSIVLNGRNCSFRHPIHAMNAGIGLVTEDRKLEGLFHDFSIKENLSIVNLEGLTRLRWFVSRRKEARFAGEKIREFQVKCASAGQRIRYLSGGNQQKVILSKWIARNPQILLLDEPTRGIDVGSKEEIYTLIRKLASEGMSLIVFSSEMPEVIALADRILVLHDGNIKGEVNAQEATQESILLMVAEDNEKSV